MKLHLAPTLGVLKAVRNHIRIDLDTIVKARFNI